MKKVTRQKKKSKKKIEKLNSKTQFNDYKLVMRKTLTDVKQFQECLNLKNYEQIC